MADVRQRISALEQMTVERGCSPAEAANAAALAKRLRARHGIKENQRSSARRQQVRYSLVIDVFAGRPMTSVDQILVERAALSGETVLLKDHARGTALVGTIRRRRRTVYAFVYGAIRLFPRTEIHYEFERAPQ